MKALQITKENIGSPFQCKVKNKNVKCLLLFTERLNQVVVFKYCSTLTCYLQESTNFNNKCFQIFTFIRDPQNGQYDHRN